MKKILIILLALTVLTSCAVESYSSPSYISIEDSINLLTSKSFDGRRPGTKGNIKTQEYLKESLESLNIQSYTDSYYWEFPYTIYNIKDAQIEVGNEKFNYSKDFQIRYTKDSSINITSVLKSEPISDEKCILLTDDVKKSVNSDKNIEAVILNVNMFNNLELIYESKIRDKPLIVVEEETYRKLYKLLDRDISINIDIKKELRTENNVVGIINAHNNPNNEAIVISAHFDHIGSFKDKLYAGALDNASGVSAILETTKFIIENIKKEEINKDIIIAFFNLEEEILKSGGSKKLSEELERKYNTVVDINIDCIGLKNSKTVVGYNNSTSINNILVKELEEMLVKSSIDTITGEYSTSDHVNFQNGICLYAEKQMDVIHSITDTSDNLDLEKIQQISSLLGDYIISLSKRNELTGVVSDIQPIKSVINTVYESERLDLGTCKVIEKNGIKDHISGQNFLGKLKEAEKLFDYQFSSKFENVLNIDELNSYIELLSFNFVYIHDKQSDGKYIDKELICNITDLYVDEHELNKVYEKKSKLDDVSFISFQGVSVEKFNNSIQHFFSDQYDLDRQSIIDNAEITLTYENYQIYYYYNEMQQGKYLGVITEIGDNSYICYMNCEGLDISSEEDIKKVIEKHNTISLWEAILDIFEEHRS